MLHWLIVAPAKTFHVVLFLLRGFSHYAYYSAKSSADLLQQIPSTMALPTRVLLEVNCAVFPRLWWYHGEKSSRAGL